MRVVLVELYLVGCNVVSILVKDDEPSRSSPHVESSEGEAEEEMYLMTTGELQRAQRSRLRRLRSRLD